MPKNLDHLKNRDRIAKIFETKKIHEKQTTTKKLNSLTNLI